MEVFPAPGIERLWGLGLKSAGTVAAKLLKLGCTDNDLCVPEFT